jgi:hypothetical protein
MITPILVTYPNGEPTNNSGLPSGKEYFMALNKFVIFGKTAHFGTFNPSLYRSVLEATSPFTGEITFRNPFNGESTVISVSLIVDGGGGGGMS